MRSLVPLCCLAFFQNACSQDFAFPVDNDSSENSRFQQEIASERSTTYIPTTTIWQRRPIEKPKPIRNSEKCPGNQLYYPGEPWYCDCGPEHIYYQPEDECFRAYMKGPCSEGQHLIVTNRKVQCVRNPCSEGSVRYNGRCYQLESSDGPCEKINGTVAILKINPGTLLIECTKTTADGLTLFNVPTLCPPGSKRDAKNKCRENWNV